MAISKIPSKKNGYTYQVDIHYKDPFGVTQRHIKSGLKTIREAKDYESMVRERANAKLMITDQVKKTINDVFDEFMELEGNMKYAHATKVYYMDTFECYLRNSFGESNITSADYVAVQKFINEESKKHNYPTVFNMRRVLNVTFKHAIRAGYLDSNPLKDVLIPNKPANKKEVDIINDDDLKKIIDVMLNPTDRGRWDLEDTAFCGKAYAMAVYIGRYTGLRISEVLALKKSDFDLKNNQLTVQRRIEYANLKRSEMYFSKSLKTKSSKKKIEISKHLSEHLKKWFAYNPYELVICHMNGDFITPSAMQEGIRSAGKRAGVKLHFHMLRHTYATELMMSGANPMVVKDLLRHSKVNTTWDVYTHPQRDDQREALDNLYMNFE